MTGCPAEAELSRFAIRALPAVSAASVETHLADCDDCRNLVFALATGSGEAPAGMAAPPVETIGRFEMLDLVGRGAMGAVYRAREVRARSLAVHARETVAAADQPRVAAWLAAPK